MYQLYLPYHSISRGHAVNKDHRGRKRAQKGAHKPQTINTKFLSTCELFIWVFQHVVYSVCIWVFQHVVYSMWSTVCILKIYTRQTTTAGTKGLGAELFVCAELT